MGIFCEWEPCGKTGPPLWGRGLCWSTQHGGNTMKSSIEGSFCALENVLRHFTSICTENVLQWREQKNWCDNYNIRYSLETENRGLWRFNLYFRFSCASCNCPCFFVVWGGGGGGPSLKRKKKKKTARVSIWHERTVCQILSSRRNAVGCECYLSPGCVA